MMVERITRIQLSLWLLLSAIPAHLPAQQSSWQSHPDSLIQARHGNGAQRLDASSHGGRSIVKDHSSPSFLGLTDGWLGARASVPGEPFDIENMNERGEILPLQYELSFAEEHRLEDPIQPWSLARGQSPDSAPILNVQWETAADDSLPAFRDNEYVTRSVLAELAARWRESLYSRVSADPNANRYGSPAGKGWVEVPDSRTVLRFTGFVQFDFIHDFQNAGFNYNWFTPALIPTPTDHTPNTEFDPRTSRFAFETHTNSEEVGSVATWVDADFFGNLVGPLDETSLYARLRQCYVTWTAPNSQITFLVGQTWSTYVDGRVWPEILDLQGPNGMTGARQVMFRVSRTFGRFENYLLDLSVEHPSTGVQNGKGITRWPDFAGRLTGDYDWGHLTGMFLLRQLVGEDLTGAGRDEAFGYGLSLSGQIFLPWTEIPTSIVDNLGPRKDNIQFQIQGGQGVGRYIFDLATTVTPQDAIYDDAAQELRPLEQFSYLVGYRHWWTDRLRSSVMYSTVFVDNLAIQDPTEYRQGQYVVANLACKLFGRMDVAIEYYYGIRSNRDGVSGEANRINLGFNYGF